MSAARRRARNALERCPGYEPNPMFLFLERCTHCGFSKAEHKNIKSEGSQLFSYLNVDDRLAQAREVVAPIVKNYLPSPDAAGAKPNFVIKRQGSARPVQPTPQSPRAAAEAAAEAASAVGSPPPNIAAERKASRNITRKASRKPSRPASRKASRKPSTRVSSRVEEPLLPARPDSRKSRPVSQLDDASAPEHPASQHDDEPPAPVLSVGPKIGHRSSTKPSQGPQSELDEYSTSSTSGDDDDDDEGEDDHISTILEPELESGANPFSSFASRVSQAFENIAGSRQSHVSAASSRQSLAASSTATSSAMGHKSNSRSRPPSRTAPRSITSRPESLGGSTTSRPKSRTGLPRPRSKVPSLRVPSLRARSQKSDISALRGEAPEDMDTSRQAHLDQIRSLLAATDGANHKTRFHFRRYEEPSTETLELYRTAGGRLRWQNNMEIGWGKVHVAAWNRDLKSLQKALKLRPTDADLLTGDCLESALSLAVKRDSLECAQALIEAGADVDMGDTFGYAPIHYAVRTSNAAIVRLIMNAKANCNAPTGEVGLTPLHVAARYAELDVIKLLLERAVGINTVDKRGWTPLFYAVRRHGKVEIVNYLLERGAELHVFDRYRITPLHCAVLADDSEICEPLIENGLRMDAQDINGWTPLHYCARYDAALALRALIEYGAHPSPRDPSELAPYDVALAHGSKPVIELLERSPGFTRPVGDRADFNSDDSCIGMYERMDTELDLAELSNIRRILDYAEANPQNGGICCTIS